VVLHYYSIVSDLTK